jgi:PAS domain-containing protein
MAKVAESDIEQCVDGLYRVLSDPSRLPRAIGGLRRLFGATGASYIQLDGQGQFRAFVNDGHDPDLVGKFVEHYAALDPTRPAIVRSSAGDWFRNDFLLSPERTPEPEYVHDFAMRAGIRWLRGGKISEDATGSAFLTVHRPADASPFGDDTCILLDRVRPHLARVFRLMAELEELLPGMAFQQAVVDMLATGICVVDDKGFMHYGNPAAESLFRRSCPLHLRHSRVGSDDPFVTGQLMEALRQATSVHGRAHSFSIPPPTTRSHACRFASCLLSCGSRWVTDAVSQ